MNRIQAVLDAAVAAGHAPGFVAAAQTASGALVSASAGIRGVGDPALMTAETVFWIASCTKAITSVAALQLVERGLLDLDEPLGARLPALASPRVLTGFDTAGAPITRSAMNAITLRHLLTHTSGLAYDFCSVDLDRHLQAIGGGLMGVETPDIPLLFEPGSGWQYGIGIDWVGKLVEAVSGLSLEAYFDQHILGPLGMTETTFFPGTAQADRRARMHARLPDGSLVATDFAMPATPYFMMGGGGLYSTAGDYLTFLRAILGGGAPLLRPEMVTRMNANQIGDLPAGALKSAQAQLSHDFEPMPGVEKRWGLAFLINQTVGPAGRSAGSLAWAGLSNCYYWADPATGAAGVLFAQVMPFADPAILATFDAFERAVYEL